ncbi:IclR family transcriptional regulator [Burkholderia sp. Bp8998]|uniref:IclR family transcriptional regulator n=1 Tax=Burkholderia sp. Bp8998 TaxID=2184557 RepID=UPI000F5B2985|nr:IclR family transcriptional regulator [Burkholderia sp. Bp8998]RQS07298.1 IclR family transcriptional regulator [Burkholderia sp. Bp8998]
MNAAAVPQLASDAKFRQAEKICARSRQLVVLLKRPRKRADGAPYRATHMTKRLKAKSAVEPDQGATHGALAPTPGDLVRSTERVAQILGAVAIGQDQGRRLSEIAEELALPPATVHRLLVTLVAQGLVEQPPGERRYYIGQEVFLLALSRRNRFPIRTIAAPHLDALRTRFGETVFLTARNALDSICIDRRTGENLSKILYVDIGNRRPLGVSVGGIPLMQTMARVEVDALLIRNAKRFAAFGTTTTEIRARVTHCRRHGFGCMDVNLQNTHYRGISVPIVTDAQETIGAIGLGAIAPRMTDGNIKRYVRSMQEHAWQIAQNVQAQS